jgi:CRISPR-associated protein Cas6/Cse3/CasE subtype I-E
MLLAQTSVDYVAAVRHLQGFLQPSALDDDSLVLKTILYEAFSGGALRPWTVHARRGPILTILGYAQASAEELNKRRALALPSVQAAVGDIIAVPLPSLDSGERYRFSVRMVPTIHVTKRESNGRRHGERDAFLVRADAAGKDAGLKRDDVYRDYLAERLAGASISETSLVQFRLRRFLRPKQDRSASGKTMPEVVMKGQLHIHDPAKLMVAISGGIGRQRAYGCGMLRLQPL